MGDAKGVLYREGFLDIEKTFDNTSFKSICKKFLIVKAGHQILNCSLGKWHAIECKIQVTLNNQRRRLPREKNTVSPSYLRESRKKAITKRAIRMNWL